MTKPRRLRPSDNGKRLTLETATDGQPNGELRLTGIFGVITNSISFKLTGDDGQTTMFASKYEWLVVTNEKGA
jgi:hypothetical protein